MTLSKALEKQLSRMDLGDLEAVRSLTEDLIAAKQAETTDAAIPSTNGHYYEEKYIKRNGKLYGPYLYERWEEGGRLRSKYVGKARNLKAVPGGKTESPEPRSHPKAS